jgi:hypothetical protein
LVTIATGVHGSFNLLLETQPTDPQGIRFSIAGQVVDFFADSPTGIRVAQTILGPYCETSRPPVPGGRDGAKAGHGAGWTVATIARHRVPGIADDLCAALDGTPATGQARRWPTDFDSDYYDIAPGQRVVVHREPFKGLTLFSRDARRILYLRAGDDHDVSHTEHCIKYPFRVLLRRAGFSQVHAGGFSLGPRGVLVVGEKGRGKSTLVVHAMGRGAKEVSNDLGYIRRTADGHCEMVAVPQITRLGAGTVADSEKIRTALAAEPRTGDYLTSPVFNNDKEEFYYPVLERIWGTDPVCRHTTLDLIVFPMLDVHLTGAAWATEVPAEEARGRLLSCLLHDSPLPEWLPFFEPAELRTVTEAAAREFTSGMPPAFELHFGGAATDPVSVVEKILKDIQR